MWVGQNFNYWEWIGGLQMTAWGKTDGDTIDGMRSKGDGEMFCICNGIK